MKFSVGLVVFCLAFFKSISGDAQMKMLCATCFDSEIVKATTVDGSCTDYQINVFYTGRCDHALSHFSVEVPSCYQLSNLSNSLNYPEEVGYDPTTGLTGFKIDNTSNFGSSSQVSFLVSFRLCKNQTTCPLPQPCWSPVVAYKAGNCFELDTLNAVCPVLRAHVVAKNVTCFGGSDGQLSAIIDEGASPFQYAWSNGSTGSSLQNINAGTYSVTIKDATGSQVVLSSAITQPDSLMISESVVNASCPGQPNGTIALTASGGSGAAYSYLWGNGAMTSELDSLKAGTYSVEVRDALGCMALRTFVVMNLKMIVISASSQLPGCNQTNGSISALATGGSEPYHYTWSNGDTTSSITNVASGVYNLTVNDAEGCAASASYFLHDNNTLRIMYSVTPTSCLDDTSGAIDATVTGGTVPYSYTWSNGASTEDINSLSSGFYTLIVKDSLGCQTSVRAFVYKKTFQITSQVTQPLCAGDSTGSISLYVAGGVPPYKFSWANGDTTSMLNHLASGVYFVTVTDSTGCSTSSTYRITSPGALQALAAVNHTACSTYAIDLTTTGGTMPYQFLWSTGAQTEDISEVGSGTYTALITDANGCSLTKTVKIDSVSALTCAINPLMTPPVCNSMNNKIFAGVKEATYQWQLVSTDGSWQIQSGATADTLFFMAGNPNTSATVSLTVTKDNCTQSCSYEIAACSSSSSVGGNSESCSDCFKTAFVKTSATTGCNDYEVTFTTDGNCRYDLSHVVVAIPCGTISGYSDSGNWPLVIGTDPTTGLTGLKVDNVDSFGKMAGNFTLKFSVCFTDYECAQQLSNWNPVVAYKAGQCIAYDTIAMSTTTTASVPYPNPFKQSFSIDVSSGEDDVITVELFDAFGQLACTPYVAPIAAGDKKSITIDGSALPKNIYLYKVKTRTSIANGRLLKSE